MLDRTGQRIVGVLLEKQRTVPDIYPMSENALVDGCNQKSNRDPLMDLQKFQVAGALMALQEQGWVARIDGGGRVTKYRHKVVERLGLTEGEQAVMAELLLRGPQAPGALRPRVARMGFTGDVDAVAKVLAQLASRPQPLVEELPLGPRERDRRWRHLLGARDEESAVRPETGLRENHEIGPREAAPRETAPQEAAPHDGAPARDLAARVAALEAALAALAARLDRLEPRATIAVPAPREEGGEPA